MSSRSWLGWGWQLGLSGLLVLVGAIATVGGDRTNAQEVTADPSVGTIVTPNGNTLEITGGTTVGNTNLFHSFSNFSVKSDEVVHFRNASTINNILVRVTGGNFSDIQGLLQAQGKANLFLINPNGIVFGENAQLDIGGSFIGTTASAIQFPGGGEFSMTSSVNPLNPLLTVNPSALLFNQIADQPLNSIQVNQAFLSVAEGQSLLLVGGDVKLEGGRLQAESGRVELGGLAGSGTVGLNIDSNNLRLSFPQGVQRADISLTNKTNVNASGRGGNGIQVLGRRVTLTNGSEISIFNVLESEPGGTLAVNASELVELLGGSRLLTDTVGSGSAGELRIETGQLIVQDGSQASASTFSEGQGGTLSVTARDSIQLIGTTAVGDASGLYAVTQGSGDAVNLRIETGRLIVQDGARVSASTRSQGRGGKLSVNATDSIQLIGTSEIGRPGGLFVGTIATGDAGNLEIETGQLIVRDRARISASTAPESTGKGGNIIVKTGKFNVLNGADVTVSSAGSGDAGELRVNANSMMLDQAKLAGTTASGRGGDISLGVQDLIRMQNGSAIATTAENNGSGGNITINAPFIVAVPNENSDILANANTGPGGRIKINATGIYGLENRSQQSEDSNISEINASSNFGIDGTVEIYTPDIDLNSGLINLPTQPVDTEVAFGCNSPNYAQSSFIVTGRGGLPPNPKDILTPDAVQVDWVTLKPSTKKRSHRTLRSKFTTVTPQPIIEATGLVVNAKGEVFLTANPPTVTLHSSLQTSVDCSAMQSIK